MAQQLKIPKILVIGSGSWGTALANLLAHNGCNVMISARKSAIIDDININHRNSAYLPNINLSHNLRAISEIDSNFDYVFIVVPSSQAREVFQRIASQNFDSKCIFIICCKGFDNAKPQLLSQSFAEIVASDKYAILSGPNFALEVAKQVPSFTTIASRDQEVAQKIITILDNSNFKAQYFNDPQNVEICGIVKNILAIGCGLIDGLELGVNTKSALLVKGITEIQKICNKINASTDIAHSAGFGDIFLTCSSTKSRNNQLGLLISRGHQLDNHQTYEGVSSAKIMVNFAQQHKLTLDLCEVIAKIISNQYSIAEIKSLLINAIFS